MFVCMREAGGFSSDLINIKYWLHKKDWVDIWGGGRFFVTAV